MKQVKQFDDYNRNCVKDMNKFMSKVKVYDVKMNTVVALTGNFFSRYLVIYEEESK